MSASATTMSRDGRITVTLVTLCQLVHGITFSAIPLLLPLIREDLAISFTEAGLLSAAATLSYALGQVPAGFLADRYGPRRLFSSACSAGRCSRCCSAWSTPSGLPCSRSCSPVPSARCCSRRA